MPHPKIHPKQKISKRLFTLSNGLSKISICLIINLTLSCNQSKTNKYIQDTQTYLTEYSTTKKGGSELCEVWTMKADGSRKTLIMDSLKKVLEPYQTIDLTTLQLMYSNASLTEFNPESTDQLERPIVMLDLNDSFPKASLLIVYDLEGNNFKRSGTILKIEDENGISGLKVPKEPFYFDPKTINELYTHFYPGLGSSASNNAAYQPDHLKKSLPEVNQLLKELNKMKIDSAYMSEGFPRRVNDPRHAMIELGFENKLDRWIMYLTFLTDPEKGEPLSEFIHMRHYSTLEEVEVYLLRKDQHQELLRHIEDMLRTSNENYYLHDSIFKIE